MDQENPLAFVEKRRVLNNASGTLLKMNTSRSERRNCAGSRCEVDDAVDDRGCIASCWSLWPPAFTIMSDIVGSNFSFSSSNIRCDGRPILLYSTVWGAVKMFGFLFLSIGTSPPTPPPPLPQNHSTKIRTAIWVYKRRVGLPKVTFHWQQQLSKASMKLNTQSVSRISFYHL